LQITEIVFGVVASVAGLLCIVSAIGSAIADAMEVTVDVVDNTANLLLDAEDIGDIVGDNPEGLVEENQAGADNADEGAGDPGNAAQVQKSGIFTSTQFRLESG
jgi:hypothetical protein